MSHRDWKVGDKVVCKRGGLWVPDFEAEPYTLPVGGNVYTIRGFAVEGDWVGLFLEEIVNAPQPNAISGFAEPDFDANGFEKVVTRKTDISVFTAMLNRQPQGADA